MQLLGEIGLGVCRPLEQQMANLECNAVCAVAITHHFLAKMVRLPTAIPCMVIDLINDKAKLKLFTLFQVAKKLKGCIVFTSSAAAAIASPFTALYAATKSFISSFGASLAVEVRHHGIDVLVFHPSPVNTRHEYTLHPYQQSAPASLNLAGGKTRGPTLSTCSSHTGSMTRHTSWMCWTSSRLRLCTQMLCLMRSSGTHPNVLWPPNF